MKHVLSLAKKLGAHYCFLEASASGLSIYQKLDFEELFKYYLFEGGMSNLYFVAGASGSGKTAILPDLKKILDDAITVYDFDDIGVPEDADKKWRQEATQKWLEKLLSDDKDACLLGQIVLGEYWPVPLPSLAASREKLKK